MQARTYLPAYGKFAQPDPDYDQKPTILDSWNLYSYVGNEPVTRTDPTGRVGGPLDGDLRTQNGNDLDHGDGSNLIDLRKAERRNAAKEEGVPTAQTDQKLVWGNKVSKEFRDKVIQISKDLGIDANNLMAIMAFETGGTFSASVKNGNVAIGLLQFTASGAESIGTTKEALGKMTNVEQLDSVKEYLGNFTDKNGKTRLNSLEDMYMAVHWPAAIGKSNDYVLYQDNGGKNKIYNLNKGLDINKDGKVTKAEAASRVRDMLSLGQKYLE